MPDTPRKLSLGARINRALGGLLLVANANAVDFSKGGLFMNISQGDGGHGKHGTTTSAPTDFQPIALEWADFFRRACDMAELDLAMERGEIERPTETRQGRVAASVSKQRRQRIGRAAIYEGRRPEFVAYVEGCSVSLVKEARTLARLDPLTGLRAERPLTASEPSKTSGG